MANNQDKGARAAAKAQKKALKAMVDEVKALVEGGATPTIAELAAKYGRSVDDTYAILNDGLPDSIMLDMSGAKLILPVPEKVEAESQEAEEEQPAEEATPEETPA